MAILVSHGNVTSKLDSKRIRRRASPTYFLYGLRYVISRRMSRASYAFPRTSSSCIFLFADRQFLFQQLLSIQLRVVPVARQQLRVRAPLDNPAVVEHDDFIGFFHSRNPMADEDRRAVPHDLSQFI